MCSTWSAKRSCRSSAQLQRRNVSLTLSPPASRSETERRVAETLSMHEAVVVSAVRTAVGRGKKDGSLANVHPIDLSALVMQEAVKRANIDPAIIDDVMW